jgi:2-keto-4-pentenoate hydratase/2-oxohepta-3-ene-1,7-dioic acid hydratase in catechol pathway
MKLLRYGPQGSEKPGLMDDQGQIRDLSEVVKDIDPDFFAGDGLRKVAALDVNQLPIVQGTPRIGACIRRPGNFIAVGLNYVQHAIETNAPIPSEPILFNKAPSCISGPFDPVTLPVGSVKSDWEVELAIVIGRDALYVSEESALDYVAGYCVCNDVSERESQLEHGGQWVKGKMFPTFGPLGPWLVTKDEIADVQELKLWLELNGNESSGFLHERHDLPDQEAGFVYQPVRRASTGRRDYDRHAAGRGSRHASRGLPQGRRHHEARD